MSDSPGSTPLRRGTPRLAVGTLIFLACSFRYLRLGCKKQGGGEAIVVGSNNFTEQIILAELFAQQIESHSALRAWNGN